MSVSNDSSEAFTHHIMNQINLEVRHSLTKVQLDEIKKAILANAKGRKHLVDIRGLIPLFFTKYYFVFLLGKDKRRITKQSEGIRRKETDILATSVFFIFFSLPLFFLGFMSLYLLKTELGIDLFSEFHLRDLF